MEDDDFEKFETDIQKQANLARYQEVVEGELLDRELQKVIDDDDFFDEDVVKDGRYIPPLDNTSPKMQEIWPDAEHKENTITIEGEVVRVQPLLIEHEVDNE